MTTEEAQQATQAHISRVKSLLLSVICHELYHRAEQHDASKLVHPEAEMFNQVTEGLRGLTYGSPEYEAQRKKMLGMALGHHYEHNRHHPEHFPDGIEGMNLIDLVEMMVDWVAAVERHADGDIFKSIEHNRQRFGLDDQLVCLLNNTAALFKKGVAGQEETTGRTAT